MTVRSNRWSTGDISSELLGISKKVVGTSEFDELITDQAIKEAGDICGCPIPLKLAEIRGRKEAYNYLVGLSEIYNRVRGLLGRTNVSWKDEWGKRQVRDVENEPWGQDASNVPEKIRTQDLLGGPGNYREFSVTRLIWEEENIKYSANTMTDDELKEIMVRSKSIEDLQVNLIGDIAERRILTQSPDEVAGLVLNGIAHEGFFKQNNPYVRVRGTLSRLRDKYEEALWFNPLEEKCLSILSSPVAEYS